MIVFLGLFFLLCVWGLKLSFRPSEINDYMSVSSTQSIKGIFIILVFFSHFNSYVEYTSSTDLLFEKFVSLFGQTMVTMFMFYSGYGIMESIRKKGIAYVNSIPSRRILATLFRFCCAVFLFALCNWMLGIPFTATQFLYSLVGWESLGNSNWYIFVILVLYLITYVSFKAAGVKNEKKAFGTALLLVCVYIFIFHYWQLKPLHWYDTVLCYILGMWFSMYRKQVERAVGEGVKNYIISLLVVSGCFLLCMKLYYVPFIWIVNNLSFSAVVVLATMRFQIGNSVLRYCGENLFEIYILQRLPMIILYKMGFGKNPVIYFLLCAAGTLLLSIPFKKAISWGWRKISDLMDKNPMR